MTLTNKPEQFLQSIVILAKEAGRRIMTIYQSDFQVNLKEDQSPLTAADLASHHYLVEALGKLAPVYPLLSEESSNIPFEERSCWETFWLIDPLDGTKEFVKRNGEFTVNVALIEHHRPVLGVVCVPAKELCYFAAVGVGAFRQECEGAPEAITVRSPAVHPLRVIGSRSHAGEKFQEYLNRLGDHELLVSGSSLKFCRVAEGSADLYPRLGPTSEWDTAAAHCIVNQAGGEVADFHGNPLRYNTKSSILNPNFLVFGDKSRDWFSVIP